MEPRRAERAPEGQVAGKGPAGSYLPAVVGAGCTTISGAAVTLADSSTEVYAALALGVCNLGVTAWGLWLFYRDRRDARSWDYRIRRLP